MSLTVLGAEGPVAPLEVAVGEDLEDDRGARQEHEQHRLEAVRSHEHVRVVQQVGQLAWRTLAGVHDHLDLPVAVRVQLLAHHGDGALLVGQAARQVSLVDHHLEAALLRGGGNLSVRD